MFRRLKLQANSAQITKPKPLHVVPSSMVTLSESTMEEFGLSQKDVVKCFPKHKINFIERNKLQKPEAAKMS